MRWDVDPPVFDWCETDPELDHPGVEQPYGRPAESVLIPARAVTPRDPDAMGVEECLAALAAHEQGKALLDAESARILERLCRRPDPAELAAKDLRRAQGYQVEEIAAYLCWSPYTAARRTHTACLLVERLPATLEALTQGRVGLDKATAIADAAAGFPAADRPALARQLEDEVLARADRQTTPEVRRAVRKTADRFDPRGLDELRADAVRDRRVETIPDADHNGATASIKAVGPVEDIATIAAAIHAVAGTAPDTDDRSADQRRFDALTAICSRVLTGDPISGLPDPRAADHDANEGDPGASGQADRGFRLDRLPTWQGRQPRVEVVVALSTLLGYDNQPAELSGPAGPTPIPADLARRIAADPTGTWTRLVTDHVGRVIDHGRTRYRPPPDLANLIIARDRTTRGLGRTTPARRCHLDHIHRWTDGGDTNVANLHALDPRAHHLKDDPDSRWTLRRTPDGATEWVLPRGHLRVKPAETVPQDRTLLIDDDPPPF